MKVRLVVEGNVQGVSYRALVKQIARRLGIKGLVRNLEDVGVEIFCEYANESVLQNFVEMIDRKGNPKEVFSLNVEKINIYNEGEKGYVNPPEEFKIFDVDYKIKLDPFQKESIEKSEIGGLLLVGTRDEVKASGEDIKEMHNDMNKSFSQLNATIGTKFESMDLKYGDISKTMREMHNDLKEMKNLFAKLVNHIVKG